MFNAIVYKEWIKTRQIISLIVVLLSGFTIYSFINIEQMFRLNGAVQVWANVILKDIDLLSAMKWLPLLGGIMLGLTQFIPEIVNKRLKLTLHLPLSETRIVTFMLMYGLLVLFIILSILSGLILYGMRFYFPIEMVEAVGWRSLPWFISGFSGYLFTAWICFEPVWRRRMLNTVIALCLLSFCFIDSKSGAYSTFISTLIVLLVVCFSFPFYSAIRFKEGVQ